MTKSAAAHQEDHPLTQLGSLSPDFGILMARTFHPAAGSWPVIYLHSAVAGWVFDRHGWRLQEDTDNALDMAVELGLHRVDDPFIRQPDSPAWRVILPDLGDPSEARQGAILGPADINVGPLQRHGIGLSPPWLNLAAEQGWQCQLYVITELDIRLRGDGDGYFTALSRARDTGRLVGGTVVVRSHPDW